MNDDRPPDYERPISGSLFLNDKKYTTDFETGRRILAPGANPKAPDYKGKLRLDTPNATTPLNMQVFAWIRETKTGAKYLSFRAEWAKEEDRRIILGSDEDGEPTAQPIAQTPEINNEELPF